MWVKGELGALDLIRVDELEREHSVRQGPAGWGPPFVGVPSLSQALGPVCEGGWGKEATIDYLQAVNPDGQG